MQETNSCKPKDNIIIKIRSDPTESFLLIKNHIEYKPATLKESEKISIAVASYTFPIR